MPTPIQPDTFARAAGFDPTDLVEAVQSGEDDYAGLPIGSWRQNGGEYLSVPDDYARQLGFTPGDGRSNPSEAMQSAESAAAGSPDSPNWPEAARDAAPPVSANAGAAYTAGRFAETVREQPQVMEDVVDGAALLGSAGLAYATAEEGEVLKAGATAAGLFAAFKGIRYLCEQGDRQTDMAERHQRHQIQKDRQKGAGSTLHRLNGDSSRTSDDAQILVTGT
jgi:hypothetical protein